MWHWIPHIPPPFSQSLPPIRKERCAGTTNRCGCAGGGRNSGPQKLEGLAVSAEQHIFRVNDADFGIHEEAADGQPPRTCLWVVRLPSALRLTKH